MTKPTDPKNTTPPKDPLQGMGFTMLEFENQVEDPATGKYKKVKSFGIGLIMPDEIHRPANAGERGLKVEEFKKLVEKSTGLIFKDDGNKLILAEQKGPGLESVKYDNSKEALKKVGELNRKIRPQISIPGQGQVAQGPTTKQFPPLPKIDLSAFQPRESQKQLRPKVIPQSDRVEEKPVQKLVKPTLEKKPGDIQKAAVLKEKPIPVTEKAPAGSSVKGEEPPKINIAGIPTRKFEKYSSYRISEPGKATKEATSSRRMKEVVAEKLGMKLDDMGKSLRNFAPFDESIEALAKRDQKGLKLVVVKHKAPQKPEFVITYDMDHTSKSDDVKKALNSMRNGFSEPKPLNVKMPGTNIYGLHFQNPREAMDLFAAIKEKNREIRNEVFKDYTRPSLLTRDRER